MQTSWIALAFLLIARATIMATPAPNPGQNSAPYELIFEKDSTIEQTGSITLRCRDSITAEEQDISEISFFLNRTSVADHSLREREDIRVVEVGSTGIKFNLTRKYEGYYTCGKRVTCTDVQESLPKPLISLQTIPPLPPPPQINFTAMSGNRVVLPCPIEPGALLQQYSVRWKKGEIAIADNVGTTDPRYQIQFDRAAYSLIINSVNISDTSSSYKCELTVVNPITNVQQVLQPSPQISLSLNVIENLTDCATHEEHIITTDSVTERPTDSDTTSEESIDPTADPPMNLWCMCQSRN